MFRSVTLWKERLLPQSIESARLVPPISETGSVRYNPQKSRDLGAGTLNDGNSRECAEISSAKSPASSHLQLKFRFSSDPHPLDNVYRSRKSGHVL